jgi:hypothetical protein
MRKSIFLAGLFVPSRSRPPIPTLQAATRLETWLTSSGCPGLQVVQGDFRNRGTVFLIPRTAALAC